MKRRTIGARRRPPCRRGLLRPVGLMGFLVVVALAQLPPSSAGLMAHGVGSPGAPALESNATPAQQASSVRGGLISLRLSAACLRALVSTSVACSQVGPAGLAACGVLLHALPGSCS